MLHRYRRMLVFFTAFASLTLASWATSSLVHAEDAAAPAAAAAPDPTKPATGPEATGNYTGAVTTGALTKDKDKVTQDTIIQDTALLKISLNMVWLMVGGFLVMYMQTGFALLETGLCRAKNAAHTMAMNFGIYGIGVLGFWACGYAFQMGGVGALAPYNGPDILH
ncbi:MAG: ammonium transporter, partial [Isosphaeraceae bacterium]